VIEEGKSEVSFIKRELIPELEAQGWNIVYGKHINAFPPNGMRMVVISNTPSDSRSIMNCLSQLKRSGFEIPTRWKSVTPKKEQNKQIQVPNGPPVNIIKKKGNI
jgi:hypothetical protein